MNLWASVAVVIATWLVTGGAVYGFIKAKIEAQGDRLESMERRIEGHTSFYVTRTEFESRHQDILRSLDRLERIGEKLISRGSG